jgi:hypothetical protein
MKKLFGITAICSVLYSSGLLAEPVYYLIDGASRISPRNVLRKLNAAGYEVEPFESMNGKSGILFYFTSTVDKNITGQGNKVGNYGGAVTMIYMCQTKSFHMPLYIRTGSTTGVALGPDADYINSNSDYSLGDVAYDLIKNNNILQSIQSRSNFCSYVNDLEKPAPEVEQPKKKLKAK